MTRGRANDALRDVPRRTIVLPVDLHTDCERLARADDFESLQAWIVVQLQRITTARHGEIWTGHARRRSNSASTT